MPPPIPTPIYRIIQVDNLAVYLQRNALHAPQHTPNNGLTYRTIHDLEIQRKRRQERIPCGPGGTIHDYLSFYFGYLSPMLFRLHTGQVEGYEGNQETIIYLVTTCQEIERRGMEFVFSDGHGIAVFTSWFEDLDNLDQVDWQMVYQRYWRDTNKDLDQQRRKQAEFLVHQSCPWDAIQEIGVCTVEMRRRVSAILDTFPNRHKPVVKVRKNWYYY